MFDFLVRITPIFLAVSIAGVYHNSAQAQTESNKIIHQIEQYTLEDKQGSINQITNVNQLRDVSPIDWSYEALRGLSERYGCISGFPNSTYKGDRSITRNEFAAGLNSCFGQIERLINSSREERKQTIIQEFLSAESVEMLLYRNKSKDTFIREFPYGEVELATLRGDVDELKGKTVLLEDKQFSPTTKLTGETIFSISDTFEGF